MTPTLWSIACLGSFIIGGLFGFILFALMNVAGDGE